MTWIVKLKWGHQPHNGGTAMLVQLIVGIFRALGFLLSLILNVFFAFGLFMLLFRIFDRDD